MYGANCNDICHLNGPNIDAVLALYGESCSIGIGGWSKESLEVFQDVLLENFFQYI